MTSNLTRDLKELEDDGFTGTLTLHFERGTVKQCEKNERWRPKPGDGPVHLSEVSGEAVDSGHG